MSLDRRASCPSPDSARIGHFMIISPARGAHVAARALATPVLARAVLPTAAKRKPDIKR
jgi:hypothetical protein